MGRFDSVVSYHDYAKEKMKIIKKEDTNKLSKKQREFLKEARKMYSKKSDFMEVAETAGIFLIAQNINNISGVLKNG